MRGSGGGKLGRLHALPAALAVGFAGLLFTAPSPAAAAVEHFGVNGTGAITENHTEPEDFYPRVEAMGGNTVRVVTSWRAIQPTQTAPDWTPLDNSAGVAWALEYTDIKFVFVVSEAPTWARDPLEDLLYCFGSAECAIPPASAHLPAWQEFIRQLVAHYPSDRIAAVEVWNEPNFGGYWRAPKNPTRWARLVKRAAMGASQADPTVPVITGGLWNGEMEPNSGDMNQKPFLTAAYQTVPDLPDFVDGIGIHPYSGQAPIDAQDSSFYDTLVEIGNVRDNYDPGKPLWATEIGYYTLPGAPNGISLQAQDVRLTEAVEALDDQPAPGIEATLIHTLINPVWSRPPLEPNKPGSHFGLLFSDLSPKPAYCTLVADDGNMYSGC